MLLIRLTLIVYLVWFSSIAIAAIPDITSITGTVTDGQQITIGGTNFINDNDADWVQSATKAGFEGASWSADGWNLDDVMDPGNDGGYVSDIKLIGANSLWLYDNQWEACSGPSISCGANRLLNYHTAIRDRAVAPLLYFSSYVRWEVISGSWPLQYMKMFLTYGPSQFYIQPKMSGDGTDPTTILFEHAGVVIDPIPASTPGAVTTETWHHFEVEITRGVTYDNFKGWWNGVEVADWQVPAGNTDLFFTELGFVNWSQARGPMNFWADRNVVSTSRIYPASKIEVSGDDGVSWRWQAPTKISETEIVFTANLPTLTATGYIVRITNNEQSVDTYTVGETTSDPITGVTKGNQVFSESFEDNNWATRSWYDGTDSTGTEAGGYSGNALKWEWVSAATRPTGFTTIRNKLDSAVDEFLVEYYVKYDTGWRGSGQAYHPHMMMITSSDDIDYQGLATSNSNLYFESISDTTTPYANYPTLSHQDLVRAVSSENDLTGVTEARSANTCDTPYALTGATDGACYSAGGWYSANIWKSQAVAIPENEWVKITAYIKTNTFTTGTGNFDGIMKLWVNADLAISSEAVLYAAGAYAGSTWDKIALGPWIGDSSPVTQSVWLDELSVWAVEGQVVTGRTAYLFGSGTTIYGPAAE